MDSQFTSLKTYIMQHPSNYADADSLLEMFYLHYSEFNPMETDRIRALFREMDEMLPDGLQDDLFGLVSGLCAEQGRAAFLEGVRVGARWMLEIEEIHH